MRSAAAYYFLPPCVVNVMRLNPAMRAASMMLITDWCVAAASALMMMTGSGVPPAARFNSSANPSGPRKGTCVRLMTYFPWPSTATLIWLGRSSGLFALAVGRLI